MTSVWPKKSLFIVAFLIPAFFALFYYAARQMAPFGSSSILTVDLGQQYVDMFAGFKHTIFQHPEAIFYSFTKNFGGEMFSEWSYYLFSPLNLFLLFFSVENLPVGILFLTVIKIGLAGFTAALFFKQSGFIKNNWLNLGLSTAYALNGWITANQVNLLWQDSFILLPVLLLTLKTFIDNQKKFLSFVFVFALVIIDNFYIGYMVGLFTPLIAIWFISINNNLKTGVKVFAKTMFAMLGSVLISAVVLIPTGYQLFIGKAQDTVTKIDWSFVKNPQYVLGKLVPGSFNFQEMQDGFANYFIPFIFIFGLVFYFLNKGIKTSSKLIAFLILIFYAMGFIYNPLILLQHMFQFPVWYPGRFSFISVFFILLLSGIAFQKINKISYLQISIALSLTIFITIISIFIQKKATFIDSSLVSVFALTSLGSIVFLVFEPKIRYLAIFSISLLMSFLNFTFSTNNFTYLTDDQYKITINALKQGISAIDDKSFYRVGQTFSRTRGDSFAIDYFGSGHFSSTVDKKTPKLYTLFGQTAGDYNASYTAGTLVTDSFFDYKYFLTPGTSSTSVLGSPNTMVNSYRPDLNGYAMIDSNGLTKTTKNKNALPIAFIANKQTKNITANENSIIENQNTLWKSLTGSNNDVFSPVRIEKTEYENLFQTSGLNNIYFTKIDRNTPAKITLTFTPSNDNSYYLTLGSAINSDTASIYINGNKLPENPDRKGDIALNVAFKNKNVPITITIILNKDSLFVNDVYLYEAKNEIIDSDSKTIKSNGIQNLKFSNTKISGSVQSAKNNNQLITSIPFTDGWSVYVDGVKTKIHKFDSYFISANVPEGKHQITIEYKEPYFVLGLSISILSLLFIVGIYLNSKRKN